MRTLTFLVKPVAPIGDDSFSATMSAFESFVHNFAASDELHECQRVWRLS